MKMFLCSGNYELSQLSVRVSNARKPWADVDDYVECGFRTEDGPGNGKSFTMDCKEKPRGLYVTLLRKGGEGSGKLRFCEVVIMGYNVTGK